MNMNTDCYYKDKAKDSKKQSIYLIWLVILVICVVPWRTYKWITHKCPEPQPPRLMSIIELQEALGAKPDGIVGPETIRLWQQYERDVIFNQYAAKYMTPSGGKE